LGELGFGWGGWGDAGGGNFLQIDVEVVYFCLLSPALLNMGGYSPLRDGAGFADEYGGLRSELFLFVVLLDGDPALGWVVLAAGKVTDLRVSSQIDHTFSLLTSLSEFEIAHSLLLPLYLPASLGGVAAVSGRSFLAGQ
jgi:hypothetical protein